MKRLLKGEAYRRYNGIRCVCLKAKPIAVPASVYNPIFLGNRTDKWTLAKNF
ncbi:MAG: hypothetical protein LBK06_02305 [Planctomycetaceae bacterium]|nr:hypothetical protein [Planctomycetaceae bacterium]